MKSTILNILRSIEHAVAKSILVVMALFFAALLGISTVQIILRMAFHTGIFWGDVASRQLTIWVGFLGAIIAASEGKHFHLDVVTRFLSRRGKLLFDSFSELFAAVVCYFLTRAAIEFIGTGLDPDSTIMPHIATRDAALIVPICFGLMGVIYLLRWLQDLPAVFGRKGTEAQQS